MYSGKVIQIDNNNVMRMMQNLSVSELSIRFEDNANDASVDVKRFCNIRYRMFGSKIDAFYGFNPCVEDNLTCFSNKFITHENRTNVSFVCVPNSISELKITVINEDRGVEVLSSVMKRVSIIKTGDDIHYKTVESIILPYSNNCQGYCKNDKHIFNNDTVILCNDPVRTKAIQLMPFFVDSVEDYEVISQSLDSSTESFRFNCDNSSYIPKVYRVGEIYELSKYVTI